MRKTQQRLLSTTVAAALAAVGMVATTAPAHAAPLAPSCLVGTVLADNKVTTDWNDVPGATSYEVWEDLYNGSANRVATVTSSTRTSGGALASGTYRYYVKALDATGASVDSPKVTLTVPGGGTVASPTGCNPNAVAAPTLELRPPALTNPKTVTIDDGTDYSPTLTAGQDYIIDLGGSDNIVNVASTRITISGGDDIVIIGGHIKASGSQQPILMDKSSGHVYVEGVRISGANEGFNLDQRTAKLVTLQNIKIDQINGTQAGHHADLVQTWGGSYGGQTRINRLDGTTTYQGSIMNPFQYTASPTPTDLKGHTYTFENTVVRKPSGGGYAFYKAGGSTTSSGAYTVIASNNVKVERPSTVTGDTFYGEDPHDTINVPAATSVPSPLLGTPGATYTSPGYTN